MPIRAPSALITDHGQRVLLRIQGSSYEFSQEEIRAILGLPPGPDGLGISIDRDRFSFEFSGDHRTVDLSALQLKRRLAKQVKNKG